MKVISNPITQPTGVEEKKPPVKQTSPPAKPVPITMSQDRQQTSGAKKGIPAQALSFAQEPLKTEPTKSDPEKPNPWGLKSMNIFYGYMPFNKYGNSNLHIVQPDLGTDVTISGVRHDQRTSHTYLYGKPRFSPDEPQFNAGFDFKFNNKFGFGLDVKHNKIIIDGYDQPVHFKGTIHGQAIDETAPLNSFIDHYELTKGNHQISVYASRSFDLPAPDQHSFTFNTKLGPSMIVSYSRTGMKNPDGSFEQETHPFQAVGYGGLMENSLRYELGPKLGRVSVEVAHGMSYLNFADYDVRNGTGSHSQWASQFSIRLGKTIDFSKKK